MAAPEFDDESAPAGGTGRTASEPSDRETETRENESAVRCPYCDRPFHGRRLETLHRGLEHPDRISIRERAAFERAYLEEGGELRRFRLYVLGALVLLYFLLLFLYAVVT